MNEQKKFYVTTPIYYVTAQPHLGSLYSTLLADVASRWNKLLGKETFFLTGTDEHGQKIAQAAAKVALHPKQFVDNFIADYKKAWQLYDVQYDRFIRTTDDYHMVGAQQLVQRLIDNGYVYTAEYTGMYCTPCETFVVDNSPTCPSCGRETASLSEETYFFKLSAFADKLLEFYKNNPDFITPKERMNEVISFVQSELHDLSISRTSVKWGVPFPGNPKHTVYVWVEALCNYLTGVGYGNSDQEKEFNFWWPADVHVLGKDIVRFHAVYWPAMLMAANLPLPKKLLVHGWIKVDKQKMSKSLGNVVDPIALQEQFGSEQIRYYLMRQIPINQDGDFSIADVHARIESDLANDLGNLVRRMIVLAHKYDVHSVNTITVFSAASEQLQHECTATVKEFSAHMNEYMYHHALARLWKFIHLVNAYFHGQEPWKVVKTDRDTFVEIIYVTCQSLHTIATLLLPVMPHKMAELLAQLGHTATGVTVETIQEWNTSFVLTLGDQLFEKPIIEEKQEDVMSQEHVAQDNYITIDDLVKVELIVGTIDACESVEGSDKLVKMSVNLGERGMRTILSGIKKYYAPSDLVGRRGLFVANLKPRKMAGLESQGMMLSAEGADGKLHLMEAPTGVPNGTRLK